MDTKAAAHVILSMGAKVLATPGVREASDAYTEALTRAARAQSELAGDDAKTPHLIGAVLLHALALISSMTRPGQFDGVEKLVVAMVESVLDTADTHIFHEEPEVLH